MPAAVICRSMRPLGKVSQVEGLSNAVKSKIAAFVAMIEKFKKEIQRQSRSACKKSF